MSDKSNNQGRAYEFACLHVLEQEISKFRPTKTIKNSSYHAAERAWNTLDSQTKDIYITSSHAAVARIFQVEPTMIERGNDLLELSMQIDAKGEDGDIRDILIARHNIQWEIGLSLKHNHFAVKHSRLSKSLDFGQKWYGVPCSLNYWNDVKSVFDYLSIEQQQHRKFDSLPDKENDVYIPLLTAFIKEIKHQYSVHKYIPRRLVEYLLGKYDFYKVISIDTRYMTQIQSYNLHGTLGLSSRERASTITIPIVALPTRIIRLDFVPSKSNTVELYMDGGWQFSFRIHNASKYVETSLKFDIQIVGMPTTIITINCFWK